MQLTELNKVACDDTPTTEPPPVADAIAPAFPPPNHPNHTPPAAHTPKHTRRTSVFRTGSGTNLEVKYVSRGSTDETDEKRHRRESLGLKTITDEEKTEMDEEETVVVTLPSGEEICFDRRIVRSSGLNPEQMVAARTLFRKFDKDNSGNIDGSELQEALNLLGLHTGTLKKKDIATILNHADSNHDGSIDFEARTPVLRAVLDA
jgi:hypothetical protein